MSDLISRTAIINKAEYEAEAMQEPFKTQLPVLVTWLAEKIPSYESEPKKGKWNRIAYDTFHCLECGHVFIVMQGYSYMNFCPNCGCDMRGEENE